MHLYSPNSINVTRNFFLLHCANIVYLVNGIDTGGYREREFSFPLKAEPKTRRLGQVVYLEDDSTRSKVGGQGGVKQENGKSQIQGVLLGFDHFY